MDYHHYKPRVGEFGHGYMVTWFTSRHLRYAHTHTHTHTHIGPLGCRIVTRLGCFVQSMNGGRLLANKLTILQQMEVPNIAVLFTAFGGSLPSVVNLCSCVCTPPPPHVCVADTPRAS